MKWQFFILIFLIYICLYVLWDILRTSLEAHTTLNKYNLWKLALRGHPTLEWQWQ